MIIHSMYDQLLYVSQKESLDKLFDYSDIIIHDNEVPIADFDKVSIEELLDACLVDEPKE
jgi:hypothetical protein